MKDLNNSNRSPNTLSNRSRLKFLAKDSLLYGGASALNKAFSLITFPLLARHFSVADFGLIDYFTMVSNLLVIFFIFGLDSSVSRFFYEYESITERRRLISQCFFFQLSICILFMLFLWPLSNRIAPLLHESEMSLSVLKLCILQVPLLVISNFASNILKWTFSRGKFLFTSLGMVVFNMGLLVVGIVYLDIGVIGVFTISLVCRLVFALIGIFFIKEWIRIPTDIEFLKQLIIYAIPFGVICCIGAFAPVFERSVIQSLIGTEELGLYATAGKIASLLAIIIQAFQTAWGPFFLSIHKEDDAIITFNWVLKLFTATVGLSTLGLAILASPIISILASDRYLAACALVFPLALTLNIQGASWICEVGIDISKKSHLHLYSYLAYLISNIICIYLLASWYGILGVAHGALLAQIIRSTVSISLSQKNFYLPWQFAPVLKLYVLLILTGLIAATYEINFPQSGTFIIFSLSLLTFLALSWFQLFGKSDRKRILSTLKLAKT